MNKNYILTIIAIVGCTLVSFAQETLKFTNSATATAEEFAANGCEAYSNLSQCQAAVTVTLNASSIVGGVATGAEYEYYVNQVKIGTATGERTLDLTQYIPVKSVSIKKLTGAEENTVSMDISITTAVLETPTVHDFTYVKGAEASPLNIVPSQKDYMFRWYTSAEDTEITGTTYITPTPSTENVGVTSYWVLQALENGCVSPRVEVKVTVMEQEDLSASDFDLQNAIKVYPNPTAENVTIELASANGQLEVFDISGRLVISQGLQSTSNLVNVSALTPGAYMFRISNENGSVVKQVLKK